MPDPRAAIALRACTSSCRPRAVAKSCRSTRRTACTARPATSRIRRRTSSGSRPKAAADRTTRTCNGGRRSGGRGLAEDASGKAQQRADLVRGQRTAEEIALDLVAAEFPQQGHLLVFLDTL